MTRDDATTLLLKHWPAAQTHAQVFVWIIDAILEAASADAQTRRLIAALTEATEALDGGLKGDEPGPVRDASKEDSAPKKEADR